MDIEFDDNYTEGPTEADLQSIAENIDNIPPMSIYEYVSILADNNPNDADLGAAVRELVATLRA